MTDDSGRPKAEGGPERIAGGPAGLRAAALGWHGRKLVILSYRVAEPDLPDALSDAERAVALLALEGLSNREMAARRRSSARTIANQLASVFRKMNVGSRSELAAVAFTRTKR